MNNSNPKLILWSITAALAGFLFGFDTVVISGAEQSIQELWGLNDFMHGFAISAALWGTVLGSLIGGFPTNLFGRKKTLLSIGLLYFVSAIWSAMANDPLSFLIARFIGGLGVGISTVAAPLFISEIAPPEKRGRLAGMFQFNIVFGILLAFASNAALGGIGDQAWRWMLGIEAIPAIIYSLMCLTLPESPRWLIGKEGDQDAGIKVLSEVNPDLAPDEIEKLAKEIEEVVEERERPDGQKAASLQVPIALAFLIAFFNQLSGINAILYFAPRIFELTGLEENAALLQSVGIGVTNLIFTFVGLWLIDKLGRRTLLFIGSFGYILSLGLCSWAFKTENFGIVPICIFAFIAAHAVGQGAVIWVFISEIFPNRFRAYGQSIGSATHWVFAALLTLFFPAVVEKFAPSVVFGFFAFMMVLQLIWVKWMVPETKGRSLESIEHELGVSKG
ncbi:MAG: sugar porter family MFS transporter [Verrucomicrobiales bacterium]|nr:sugar porter family MFS transporter [Verrucomicrobiales bacterium]